jgi:hypothetical protein
MTEKTAIKKPRKANTSKAAQIRKLFAQGKLTPKQIGEKVGAPMPYVYVVRSKMKAEAGGLPAVAEKKIPVLGGIQEVANEHEARVAPAPVIAVRTEQADQFRHMQSPALAPVKITMVEPPTFFERVKERIRAWLS